MADLNYARFFEEVGIGDVGLVGGKNASWGEMYRELSGEGVLIPHGLGITADAYLHARRRRCLGAAARLAGRARGSRRRRSRSAG